MTDERPVLDKINLVVRDMDAMVAFYEQLGVSIAPVESPWTAWEPHHRTAAQPGGIDLDLDSTAFASQWNAGRPAEQTGPLIGFRFASRAAVDDKYTELTAAGYAGQQPPVDAFWGARYAVVTDPEGNAVGLMSPADPAFRADPPPAPST